MDDAARQAFFIHDRLRAAATGAQGAGSAGAGASSARGAGISTAVVLAVCAAAKVVVIERDADLLTKEESLRVSAEVAATILEELFTWVLCKCFELRPLQGARNGMGYRRVFKRNHPANA